MTNQLADIQKEVFARRPVLKQINHEYFGACLEDYVKDCWQVPAAGPDEVFLNIVKAEAEAIYGVDAAKKIISLLVKKALVSSIDHLGIWGHPIFVNADLIYSLHFEAEDYPLALATESVSLNNTSSWSASLLWHNDAGDLERSSFFADKFKTQPVFSCPVIKARDIERFQSATGRRFEALIDILGIRKTSALNFSVQACQASQKFWQAVFPSAPKLTYLPLETIVSKYLLKVFENPEHVLSKIVLTQKGRRLWEKYFSGEHTLMFWAIDGKGRRQAITTLPENLADSLKKRQIYPSSPLCFMALLYAGLACAGGFTQTTWLTEVKAKFSALLSDLETGDGQIDSISGIPTQNFAESSLAWLSIAGKYLSPSAVDLYLTGQDYYPQYSKLAGHLTLGQSLALAMPTIYSVVTPKAEQFEGFNLGKLQDRVFEEAGMENSLALTGF